MSIYRYLSAGLMVGLVSVIYNFLVFEVFHFYPDQIFAFLNRPLSAPVFFVFIFLKSFLVGLILMVLFITAYDHIRKEKDGHNNLAKGIFWFFIFGIFALFSFSIGDMFLMKTQEGMLVLLVADGFVESIIAMMPLRLFYFRARECE